VYRELMTYPKFNWSLRLLKVLIVYWGSANIVKNWCINYLPKLKISSKNSILYSFWFDATAGGGTPMCEALAKASEVLAQRCCDVVKFSQANVLWTHKP
jgi:hypothetical protein